MTTGKHLFTQTISSPLRIAVVSETYPPDVNGVAVTVAGMVGGMRQRGHYVHLVRLRHHKRDVAVQEEGYAETLVSGIPLPGCHEWKIGMPARNRLLRQWQLQRPDIVHIATEGPLGWSAMHAARKLGIPVATNSFYSHLHNVSQHHGTALLSNCIASYLRNFHNKADCTMVSTVDMQKHLQQAGYKNVEMVTRGIDTELFHPRKRSEALRQQWGADVDTPVVVLVSRLTEEKNLQVVINAFEQMQVIIGDAKLVMVGDGPARARLQKQYPQIVFAGMRTGEDLAEHYASGDVFLYPSLTESYGSVTVEAMASGLAVLAYDYAAARQYIRHDVNGLLAPFNDTDAFFRQAIALIQIPDRIQRLRNRARLAVEPMAWANVAGKVERLLLNIVYSKGAKHDQTELSPERQVAKI
ncbi:MAG: glycoside hydrolase [Gallionellales bacterium 35-53-114]|jgi:glycosyltransferase involved in cell wall biosynthesis|nr:MAG: glycoside hydrolase [Gallionellales bacterium 35-53-114]OYZ62865.1 MAG: glycoside hydrolase [Gallionellales bacterium 24-53-125]OZB09941.1 MAG: glycoside hydrolase [Gallionellales bacterium 39-52-133]HQS58387.1 glycosyltransferase family 1 protein [Gallionellaceae bacterium]HQS73942.1 glycosyltransferase family 1 protein [Gallionellaceae bacterium]